MRVFVQQALWSIVSVVGAVATFVRAVEIGLERYVVWRVAHPRSC